METKKQNFVVNRIESLKYAIVGALYLIKTENAIKVHCTSTVILSLLGYFTGLSKIEWMFQFLAIGLVISVEALNTSIEKIADFIQPDFDKKIGTIKDVSAGAVLFAGLFGAIIIGFIYIPKLILFLYQ
ncbi:diacylglycerol kinase [Wenyingzhuangia marina]|uniref:Diacylglycerol kinase (ATP) n=1 Tax=Wenyingzhuangia marina TaxID=1195760 RepID=A0A1M5VEU5_9FLAO|nr:diacylglycerol kinase family protein [Wenyingzhuangia marina]GGF72689.1 diacylglycerol kinase [Wenyingzhuangia marina]SHH73443.1 diacylglycerol kinase (ATP) [Wenyingzhuangia marina]